MEWSHDQAFADFQPALSEVEEGVLSMFSGEDREVALRLLERTKARIFSDYIRASPQLKPFLLILMRRLVDPKLTIGGAKKSAKLGGAYSYEFRRLTDLRPRDYLEHYRIEFARGILRHMNDRRVHIVAYAVGFKSLDMLSKVYSRKMGYPPSNEEKAEPEETRSLLKSVPPTTHNRQDPRLSTNTAETDSHAVPMDEFWSEVEGANRVELKDYMLRHVKAIDIEHFNFLIEKAKYEGRVNRKRGQELALSALDALNLVEFWRGKAYPVERSLGCAAIGNQYRLGFELEEAEKWLQLATRFLPGNRKDLLFARVNQLKASLLWWQRRVEEAIDLFNVVLPIVREHGSKEFLSRTLQLGAEIYLSSGHEDRAELLLSEAIALSQCVDDSYVVFSAHFNLTFLYARLLKPSAALAQFDILKRLKPTVHVSRFHLAWLEGAVCSVNGQYDVAEQLFMEAKEGFISEGLDIYAGLASLQLSLVLLEQSKQKQAFRMASSVTSLLSRYSYHKEAVAALAIIQEAVRIEGVDHSVIRKALHHLELVRTDPTSNFLVRHQE